MASDPGAERAFAYWPGWHAVGCAVIFFGLLGAIGVSLLPAGYERVRMGQMPTGVAMMVLGVFGVPTLFMSLRSLYSGLHDTFRPPLLRVTATGLVLPKEARGEPPRGEHGELLSDEPPHPEAIPFAAIRSITRGGPPHNHVLDIAHDLSAEPLRLHQYMMRTAEFNELCALMLASGLRFTQ